MSTGSKNKYAAAKCRKEFIESFAAALAAAGGTADWAEMKELSLQQAMYDLAVNGIRFVFVPHGTLNEHEAHVPEDVADVLDYM